MFQKGKVPVRPAHRDWGEESRSRVGDWVGQGARAAWRRASEAMVRSFSFTSSDGKLLADIHILKIIIPIAHNY